jgi:hypothetical protein
MSDNQISPDEKSPLDEENKKKSSSEFTEFSESSELKERSESEFTESKEFIKENEEREESDLSKEKDENSEEIESLENSQNIQNTEETKDSAENQEKIQDEIQQENQLISQLKSRPKDTSSNYQISLINQNLLKVNVSTKSGVKLNSSVKNRDTTIETQSNEIYLYPKIDRSTQEISVMISIDEESENIDSAELQTEQIISEIQPVPEKETVSKSNYQVNLINENLLKIKIETPKGVKIDSISRDKKTTVESQTNKIYLNPVNDNETQIIEITIEIDSADKEIIPTDIDGNVRLIPNPEVVDLIQPPTYPVFEDSYDSYEPYDPETGYKNPFDALRKLIQKNTAIGITAAVILHLLVAGVLFFNISKKAKEKAPEEQQRLIIIQDLPDPKIKLENVEDPNKPEVPDPPANENNLNLEDPKREIKPRKTIQPPIISRPESEENKDTSDLALLESQLDSLRKLAEGISFADSLMDSTNVDTSTVNYDIADSLRNNFNENDIGLAMYFPKNWKLTDQREINKSETEFKGVLLTDTTAEQPGTLTMFIYLDTENKDYNAEDFKTEFPMVDSTLTAFLKEPKTLAGFTEYRFYIFNKLGTEKLSLRASVRKQFFEQYKNEIEAVVRSIRISKPEPEKKDSLN